MRLSRSRSAKSTTFRLGTKPALYRVEFALKPDDAGEHLKNEGLDREAGELLKNEVCLTRQFKFVRGSKVNGAKSSL